MEFPKNKNRTDPEDDDWIHDIDFLKHIQIKFAGYIDLLTIDELLDVVEKILAKETETN